jgi:hypothetical protein
MRLLVSPPIDWNNEVRYNYKDQRLKNLLIKLEASADKELKEDISHILNGSAWDDAKKFPWSKPPAHSSRFAMLKKPRINMRSKVLHSL